MPLKVSLVAAELGSSEPDFVVKSKQDYLKIGHAAARWAREAVRCSMPGDGVYSAHLHLRISFFDGVDLPENLPGADLPDKEAPDGEAPKRRRKRGKK